MTKHIAIRWLLSTACLVTFGCDEGSRPNTPRSATGESKAASRPISRPSAILDQLERTSSTAHTRKPPEDPPAVQPKTRAAVEKVRRPLRRAETPLSVRIELDASRKPPSIDIDSPFRVVLTNTSDRPVSIWSPRTREGYYRISFHFMNSQTGVEHVARKRQIQDVKFWDALGAEMVSGSDVIQIAPHHAVGFQIQFSDFAWGQRAWTGLPDPNSPDRLSVFAEIESAAGASKGGRSIWVGRTRSADVVAALLATRMRTPHQYLWNGFPGKALEIMRADHSWISRQDEDQCTPLHHAARFGYPEVVKWLLEHGADVNAIAYNGFTPLHLAERRDVIALILDKHPDLSIRDRTSNQTPPQKAAANSVEARSEPERREWQAIMDLYAKTAGGNDVLTAVKLGDLARVKALLGKSPELADNFQDQSLLRAAASLGRLEICRYLIDEHHVDVNDFVRGSGYPIIKGALMHPQVVRLLIEKGADLKKRITWQGFGTGMWIVGDDATALHFAAEEGVPETIKLLIDNGVDIFAAAHSPDSRDQDQTALDVAAIFGKVDNAIAILDHPSFQQTGQATRKRLLNKCLVLAAHSIAFSDQGERPKLLEALLKRGADPNASEKGVTAIQAAAQGIWPNNDDNRELKDAVAVLLKHGATLDLYSAVAVGDNERVRRLLVQNPASANARNRDGYPALHLAIAMNYENIAKRLLTTGCDVEIANQAEDVGDQGDTPLHAAAFWGRYAIAEELIARGANVNATSKKKWTPLHDAAATNNTRVARLLLEKGAKYDAQDADGKTPLDLARRRDRGDLAGIEALFSEYQSKNDNRATK
jgi:ankyrin repeat protein